jgi:hypothetical protein
MADENKCAHKLCNCAVDDNSKYCSPQCESADAEDVLAIECECRHPGCD